MALQFQILGPFTVTGDDSRPVDLGGAKPAALLAMLALRPNELVPADRLIEDLWDGQPPATAPKTLQVHVSRLRRVLPDGVISTTSGGYVLVAEPDQVDAQRFSELVAEGTAAMADGAHARASGRLRAALGLWRGDALADFAYASFAQDPIARLDGLRTVAREAAIEAELALGRHAELIPELRELVKRHPLSEHLRAQLMLALYRSGRQAEALGVYRAGRRILVDQLGIEPSEELRELERRILEQDAELAAPQPVRTPRAQSSERPSRGALVGYEQELASLEDLLEQALLGQGRFALISGEPGIGKSRLADELAAVAQARGAQVVWGRCATGGGAPAYWPWIQILRALVADRDPASLRTALGAGGGELVQLVPDLGDLVAAAEVSDPEEGRFRLHDAAAAFVARIATERPLVIVFDDLHAADASSLALLQFAASALLAAPVLIVATYRDTEVAGESGITDSIGELARTTDCLQLVLTGLTEEDTAHFVEVTAGVEPMPALAAAVHAASSGNPLFVTELVRLLRTEDRLHEIGADEALALPRGVDQVIARRAERLSGECRAMLAAAAVIGREFDARLLEQGADELLDEAVRARLIDPVTNTPAGFRFSHELVRQTLQDTLGNADRRRLHAAIATRLEELESAPAGAAAVASLAYHYSNALPDGDADKAVFYLAAAGDNAADLGASEEAASWYSRAGDVGRANGLDAARVCELYIRVAEQLLLVPDVPQTRAAIDAAEQLAPLAPDPSRDARLDLAKVHLSVFDSAALSREQLHAAIEFFQQIDDPAGEARAWDALATLHCGYSEKTQEGHAGRQMLGAARRAGNPGLVGRAMGAIAASYASGSTPVSEAIPRVNKLSEEAQDPVTRARLKTSLSVLHAASGRFDDARAALAEGVALTPASERAARRMNALSWTARLELLAGNYHRAEEIARELCAYYRAGDLVTYLSSEQMFLVDALVGQGRLTEAAVELESAPAPAPDDTDALFRQARSRAALELAGGELAAAEEHARAAAAFTDGEEVPDEHCQTLLVLARVLVEQGRDEDGRAVLDETITFSSRRENVVLEQRARELLATTELAGAA